MNDHHPIWDRDNALRRLLNNESLLNRVLTLFFEQAENRLGEDWKSDIAAKISGSQSSGSHVKRQCRRSRRHPFAFSPQ